jgi:hypothetical protein
MTKVTLPLPPEVDVSDLKFMPLQDNRLMKSRAWLKAKNWRGSGGPGLGFCLLNLWVAAFRTKPAGSLDDDDDMLAEAARCDIGFWQTIKDEAMRGWEQHDGRLWHPVICEIAMELWMSRLAARHIKTLESHRAAAKRAMDRGVEPPDPPGGLLEWMERQYPATAAYQDAVPRPGDKPERPPDRGGNLPDKTPKQSKGKDIPPFTPQTGHPDAPALKGLEGGATRTPAERKLWFARELNRLENEFSRQLPLMRTYLGTRQASWKYGLVKAFRGCWLGGATGPPEIVAPSVGQARAILADHGEWLRAHWPNLTVRHARVDELRARKAAA